MFKKYTKKEKKQFPFVAAMLIFPIVQFLIFYVYININTFVLAFTDRTGAPSLNAFKDIVNEWNRPTLLSLQDSIIRSMLTWGINIFIVFPLSILFTYALFKKVRGEKVFRVIFFLPGMLGEVVVSTLFRYLVNGPISDFFYKMGWISEELYEMGFFYGATSFKTILIYGVWLGLVGNIVVLTGAMSRIPSEVLEYARLDGVGFFREFFQIVMPLIWPTVSTLLIYQLSGIFTADSGTFLLTGLGNSEASTMSYYLFQHLYDMAKTGSTVRAHYPAAVGVVVTLVTIPIVVFIRNFLDKHTEEIVY